MQITANHRYAAFGILATWCAYLAFALLTGWDDYGLSAEPAHSQRWIIHRMATVSAWLLIAAMLLRYRKHALNWRSSLYGAVATSMTAIMVAPTLVPQNANYAVIAGTIASYALVSGFLCITLKKPWIAAVLGVILFPLQLAADGVAHLLSGVFRIH